MEILHRKTIVLDRSSLFIAIAKNENNYTIFQNEFSKLSNFGIWFTRSLDKILREDNPNLSWKNWEDSARYLDNKILETRDELKEFYRQSLEILQKYEETKNEQKQLRD